MKKVDPEKKWKIQRLFNDIVFFIHYQYIPKLDSFILYEREEKNHSFYFAFLIDRNMKSDVISLESC